MCLLRLLFPNCKTMMQAYNHILNRPVKCSPHIQLLHTFFSKWYGSNGNRTNGSNSLRDWNLSRKMRSGVEFANSLSTISHPYHSLAPMHHLKIALRTLSSDVTVRSWCCKTHNLFYECLRLICHIYWYPQTIRRYFPHNIKLNN